jgi:hypothetical protein
LNLAAGDGVRRRRTHAVPPTLAVRPCSPRPRSALATAAADDPPQQAGTTTADTRKGPADRTTDACIGGRERYPDANTGKARPPKPFVKSTVDRRRALSRRDTVNRGRSDTTFSSTGALQRATRVVTAVGCPARKRTRRGRYGNDPSAGSPTETLLRLLLPLDDQV